ncbi:hypothetical protein B0H66DRAFT_566995 [Apodospora peruviana]|uniref:Uncharacterized protein n=1 Tax=Apodospora peruviana TaxID=516989 RepID=A0AAE0M0M2_9PEZI|nr:hypothetical protein B0H66DRAFT_566995 [Apodospora peruviana]
MSVVSPIIVGSNGAAVRIGSQAAARVDMTTKKGICFGPQPFTCTSSLGVFPSKSAVDLARSVPASRGGGNVALARLALGLQANFAILSGIVLFILIILDLAANLVQIYFNVREESEEYHIKAALWARSLDWATAAAAVAGFSSFRALVVATPSLIQAASSPPALITINSGGVASNLFAAVVAMTVAGAVINTLLTMSEVGSVAVRAAKATPLKPSIRTVAKMDISKPDYVPVYKRRPAYEVFP